MVVLFFSCFSFLFIRVFICRPIQPTKFCWIKLCEWQNTVGDHYLGTLCVHVYSSWSYRFESMWAKSKEWFIEPFVIFHTGHTTLENLVLNVHSQRNVRRCNKLQRFVERGISHGRPKYRRIFPKCINRTSLEWRRKRQSSITVTPGCCYTSNVSALRRQAAPRDGALTDGRSAR